MGRRPRVRRRAPAPGRGHPLERGEISRNDAGEIIREVFLTGADGSTGIFRQTFRPLEGGKYAVSLLRQTGENWAATFPGSDRLLMVPRAG